MEFKDIIRQLRESRGLTQVEAAKMLGFHSSAISQWESGKRKPDFETLQKLAAFYNVSIAYLLGETNLTHSGKLKSMDEIAVELKRHGLNDQDIRHIIDLIQLRRLERKIAMDTEQSASKDNEVISIDRRKASG